MLKRFIQDIKRYFVYSVMAARAELKAEVADSYLNWVWWILDPLCFMLIYTFIFGYVFNSSEQYFPVYIFIGLSMWTFFNKTAQASVMMVKRNKAIVTKVYFPKYILLVTRVWVNGFKMMVSFGIVVIMMIVSRIPISWNVLYFIPILLVLVLFTFGFSCFTMHLGVYISDLNNIMAIFLRMMFYITGIFYNLEKRIPEFGMLLNRYNPVAFLLSSMRRSLIYQQAPEGLWLLIWAGISIVLTILGIRLIYKEENSYVKAI